MHYPALSSCCVAVFAHIRNRSSVRLALNLTQMRVNRYIHRTVDVFNVSATQNIRAASPEGITDLYINLDDLTACMIDVTDSDF